MRRVLFDPGALNNRITLQVPTETSDGCGGIDVSWSDVAEVWARMEPRQPLAPEEAQQVQEYALHNITIRYRTDIETGWRLSIENRSLEVLSVTDPDERKAYLILRTREEGR